MKPKHVAATLGAAVLAMPVFATDKPAADETAKGEPKAAAKAKADARGHMEGMKGGGMMKHGTMGGGMMGGPTGGKPKATQEAKEPPHDHKDEKTH